MKRFASIALLTIVAAAASVRSAPAGWEQYSLTYAYYGRYYAQLAEPEVGQPVLMPEILNQIRAGIDNTTNGINTAHKPYYSVAKVNFEYAWRNSYYVYSASSNMNVYNAYFYCWYAQYAATMAAM